MVCFLCIGSNYHSHENLAFARARLKSLFPDIRFAKEEETEPLFLKNKAKFSDQVALFTTTQEESRVKDILKAIEREAGRCFEDKQKETVRLDIDLLACDDRILKPDDMQREYIQRGIKELLF